MSEQNNINYFQIPTDEALGNVKLEFEETEPKKVDEVDPTTMERIKYFNKARLARFGNKTLRVYERAA